MTPEFITTFFMEGLRVAILVSGPLLLSGLAAGVLVSMFQAATSINEMTLVFIPKMMAVGLALLLLFPWMLQTLTDYTFQVFTQIPTYIR